MIYLLNRSVFNGDALSRLGFRAAQFPMHEYYTVGMKIGLDVTDIIREYNIVRVTVVNNITMASGTSQDWIWLVRLLRETNSQLELVLADNIASVLPDVFRNTSLVKR